jgi:hypothetical protein
VAIERLPQPVVAELLAGPRGLGEPVGIEEQHVAWLQLDQRHRVRGAIFDAQQHTARFEHEATPVASSHERRGEPGI